MHDAEDVLKVVVVGAGGVGKSSITIRFLSSRFEDNHYDPTIEDNYLRQLVVDDEAVQLEILDTAGQEEYAPMADGWFRFGRAFLLVYSITDRASFDVLPALHTAIKVAKDAPAVPLVLVSNKCDLEHRRQVSSAEGQALARSLRAPFVETSALDGFNVDIAFDELVRRVRRGERVPPAQPHPPKSKYELRTRRRSEDIQDGRCCVIM
ncbi:hypothetical protein Q8F55_004243 [Vanrija albida]|uniref:Uncharacterized protein n=1 Tax=Vanrija albida TaxID=181172 RepID=A0ABR3Q7B8_9TREE